MRNLEFHDSVPASNNFRSSHTYHEYVCVDVCKCDLYLHIYIYVYMTFVYVRVARHAREQTCSNCAIARPARAETC